jgi:hypothetical protein
MTSWVDLGRAESLKSGPFRALLLIGSRITSTIMVNLTASNRFYLHTCGITNELNRIMAQIQLFLFC